VTIERERIPMCHPATLSVRRTVEPVGPRDGLEGGADNFALERFCDRSSLSPDPTTLVVAAHPDDETIGAGVRIAKLAGTCVVIHVTDGAPGDRRFCPPGANRLTRVTYARARREEALRALALAGVDASRVQCLGVRDQEVAFDMARVAGRIAAALTALRPELVVTHSYEGGHPDHDAVALAVHAAAALSSTAGGPSISILEMTGYHDEGGATVRGEFLLTRRARETTLQLSDEEQRLKRAMLAAYITQRDMLSRFRTETERFRVAPRYAFGAPPHNGRLHYERFGFRLSGAMWRALARAALKKMALDEGNL
jgi:LmbE family N-acetylglucosaminyl deacetylase